MKISKQVITIGRDPKNVLVLNEPNVSSVHAQMTILPDGGVTLEDLGSTNGTSVGTVENKINRTEIDVNDTIFLGSTAYQVRDLLARAASVNKSKPTPINSRASSSKGDNTKIQPWSIGAVVVVCLLLAAGMFLTQMNGGPNINNTDLPANPPVNIVDNTSANPKPSLADNDDQLSQPEAKLTDEEKLARSLFLLVCSDSQGTNSFRVGTAFAVDSRHVATSAAAIQAMQDLKQNGYPNSSLFCPSTGETLSVESSRIHPQYEKANSQARRAQQEHDAILDDLESNPADEKAFERVKQQLSSSRMKAFDALERKTSCDVGVLEVDRELEFHLSGIAKDASLRPKLKLNVTGYAFDLEDPYFDEAAPMKPVTMSGRIRRTINPRDESHLRLEVDGTDQQLEHAFLGSPAIDAHGQVVGIYSRPSPPIEGFDTTKQNITFEACLFERIRECLAD